MTLLNNQNRYPVPKEEAGDLLLFPIMAALAKFPMTISQLSRTLQIMRGTTTTRVRELAKYGYVVQRKDGKWVLVVRLRVERPLEPVGLIGHDPVLGVRSGGFADDPASDHLPAATARPGSYKEKGVVVEGAKPGNSLLSPQERLSRYFRVPEEVPEVGTLSLGPHDRCRKCMKSTQLRYGGTVMCAGCARVASPGGKYGNASANTAQ